MQIPFTLLRRNNHDIQEWKEVSVVYIGQKAIQAVYMGAVRVWQAVRSCFGSGVWINEKP